jgi:DNA-binding LacI/PurR family transcriptional regulator
MCRSSVSTLSSIRIRHYEIGQVAADLLLQQIAGPDRERQTVVLQPQLIIRASCAPPRYRGVDAGLPPPVRRR